MKLTLAEVVNSVSPLNRILEKELPFSVSYKFMTIADKVEEHNKRYQKLHREMVEKYGEKVTDDGGEETGEIRVKPENNEKFIEEHRKLLESEVEVDVPVLSQEELSTVTMKPKDIMALRKFITD